jgi:hypothetical protein
MFQTQANLMANDHDESAINTACQGTLVNVGRFISQLSSGWRAEMNLVTEVIGMPIGDTKRYTRDIDIQQSKGVN